MTVERRYAYPSFTLNESPSEKEGKSSTMPQWVTLAAGPSMKVPPKRKGNMTVERRYAYPSFTLNESPSEKEGKCASVGFLPDIYTPSMKVPPKRKGNTALRELSLIVGTSPSMKVPPKRKGNNSTFQQPKAYGSPSMKVPPKRKGNLVLLNFG